jgi:predicted Fe-Mo cluster-binding NifX family protein
MKIAFPTQDDRGMESPVYGHFGSAPYFIIVDDETGNIEAVSNRDMDHIHGQCQPMKALGRNKVDAVVVGGIGAGALNGLLSAGIKPFRAIEGTVADNLKLVKAGALPQFTFSQTCAGHGAGGPCAH